MGSFSYHVGQRIKKYRKSRGYTIEQFSAMINKSKATVSKYENGTITIDVETLYDVARALDIDLKCFIDYQPPVFHAQSVLPKNFYFNQPRAYMYYYDGRVRQLVRSLLCFSPSASGEGIDVPQRGAGHLHCANLILRQRFPRHGANADHLPLWRRSRARLPSRICRHGSLPKRTAANHGRRFATAIR